MRGRELVATERCMKRIYLDRDARISIPLRMHRFSVSYNCPFDGRSCEAADVYGEELDFRIQERVEIICLRCARGHAVKEKKRIWLSGIRSGVSILSRRDPKSGP